MGTLAVEGGLGDASYASNSNMQAGFFAVAQPVLLEAIKNARMELFEGKVVHIADMGCSSGPNTINAMASIVDALLQKFRMESLPRLEIQAFFSDLRTNDFNTLFTLLGHEQGRPYFYAAVPGSFYGRLFPCSSIHVAMCSISLHWLSEVPNAVLDKNSLAWNAGNVWVDQRSKSETKEAFQEQAHKDLCQFLGCRAQEVVQGGLLFLLILGTSEQDPCSYREPYDIQMEWRNGFQLAWEDLVNEGLISQEALDNFDVPMFFRSTSDVTRAAEETASFKILHLECSSHPMPNYTALKAKAELEGEDLDPSKYAFDRTMACKTLCKEMVQEHLGNEELVEELFRRMESKIVPTEPVPLYAANIIVALLERQKI